MTIIFNAGASQYVISVRNKLTSSPVGCLSTPISRTVVPLNLNTITINPNPDLSAEQYTDLQCKSERNYAGFNGMELRKF
ncbi:hypothetical protein EJ377_16160 [Chryseobacterium arthrosphaerae]|uniref:Uncharacterized protein n=1 Tax=Chryseobacterium arthrosphaerae TaxID=651561 RepID=A0A3S0N1B5_9FLAO|nr:hypothetical protein EJ377_16160 [Chryseobacterium arthrosphaerae]